MSCISISSTLQYVHHFENAVGLIEVQTILYRESHKEN